MRRVVVFGGSGGIGRSVIEQFLIEKSQVINISRTPSNISGVIDYIFDVSDPLLDLSFLRDIDVVVDCIGINIPSSFENFLDEDLDVMFEVNIKSKFRVLRALFTTNSLSHVVIISSIWGISARRGRSIYGACKHALSGLVKTLAIEYGEKGCLVNLVSPGFTLTDLTKRTNHIDELEELRSKIPLKRLAEPVEIALLIQFLTSSHNTYITGQNIIIDGGFTI